MATTISEYWYNFLENYGDPRVSHLFLMSTPNVVLTVCALYLLTILKIGPALMKDRKPYNLKKPMLVYNLFSVVSSAYVFYECLHAGWFTRYSFFKCNSMDKSLSENGIREIRIFYIYFLCKFVEFFDTIFFVLRKKDSQITFLHVYHHVSMPIYMWVVTKFYPGGSFTIIPLFNSFIHVIMYTYYLLAGLGPHMQKYLWWKRHLTVLQLIQFGTGVTHFVITVFSTNECNLPKLILVCSTCSGAVFYLLFSTFYKTAYTTPSEKDVPNLETEETKSNNIKSQAMLNINNGVKIKSL